MILVVNAGSSNIKFAVYDPKTLQLVYKAQAFTMQDVYAWLQNNKGKCTLSGVGHRVVHGGTKYSKPVIINNQIITQLERYIPLAPLHQPHNLAAIKFLRQQYPNLMQVACFDTAFHTTQLPLAKEFPLPSELTKEGVIRYGFHGLSYQYIASVLEQNIGNYANKKVIVAHLGNGASMCAMEQCRSVATSMGFTALDGLMMGTRTGSIDPGVLLYLLQEKNYTADTLVQLLYYKSGLLGVSNLSNDMRELLGSAKPEARHAIDLFCFRAASEFCKLLAPLQGCEALIFTGGIGENAPLIRQEIVRQIAWFGVKLDAGANNSNKTIISAENSKIMVAMIPTNEEYVIAKKVQELQTKV